MGRDAELARLEALYREAAGERRGQVALVTGSAGIGKSRLCGELKRRLRSEGVPVFEGRCRPGGAYEPVLELAQGALAHLAELGATGDLLAEGADLVRALAGRGEGAEGGSRRPANAGPDRRLPFFERVRTLVAEAAASRAPLVLLSDVHLADGAAAALLAYVVRMLAPAPGLPGDGAFAGLIVVTARDATGAAWLDDVSATELPLAALDEGGVRAFLSSPLAVDRLLRASGGVPRRLEALLAQPAPDAATQLAERFAALSEDARWLARVLAVHARPAGADLLERLGGRGKDIAAAAKELGDSPLFERSIVGGDLRLGYALAADREAVVASSPETERAGLHRAVGEALAAWPDGPPDPAACAEHLLLGGAGERAVDAAIAAGEGLEWAFAYERAAGLYGRALTETRRSEVAARLERRLAELFELAGDYPRALEAARKILMRRGDDAPTLARIGHLYLLKGDLAIARETLVRARTRAESAGDRATLVATLADSAEAAFLSGDHDGALAAGREAIALCEEDPEKARPRIAARNSLGKVALEQGDYGLAARLFEENLVEARRAGIASEAARALINQGIASLRAGDYAVAEKRYRDGLAAAEEAGDVRHRAFCLQNLGVLAQWRRDYAAALVHYEDAARAFKRLGHRPWLAWVALDLGDLYLGLGDAARAQAMADLATRLCKDNAPPTAAVLLGNLEGRILEERGDRRGARARFETARAQAAKIGNRDEVALLLVQLAKLELAEGNPPAAVERLGEIAEPISAKIRAQAGAVRAEAQLELGAIEPARAELAAADRIYLELGDDEGRLRVLALRAACADRAGDTRVARLSREAARVLDAALRARIPAEFAATYGRDPLRLALLELPTAPAASTPASTPRAISAPPALPVRADLWTVAPRIIGTSPRLRPVFDLIDRVAPHDSLVLIRGESGTGKELVAEALHERSPRRGRPFVKVNCGALVDTLLLSELFGHERGAFTGALARKKGRFELADGGTLFLDEIGDISPQTQVALLRVLQTHEFERVGGTQSIRVDVRIVCATHRDLEAMVADGRFREDLYYRLKGIEIELPPLRARPGDIPLLAEHFLAHVAKDRGAPPKKLTAAAIAHLAAASWPGNIRELENVIRSVSLFADGDEIDARDLLDYTELTGGSTPIAGGSPPSPPPVLHGAVRPGPGRVTPGAPPGPPVPDDLSDMYDRALASGLSLRELKRRIEHECIVRALADAGGNITRAAELLRMKRPRLSQLLKEHGIAPHAARAEVSR